jgi:hypothetical protein
MAGLVNTLRICARVVPKSTKTKQNSRGKLVDVF